MTIAEKLRSRKADRALHEAAAKEIERLTKELVAQKERTEYALKNLECVERARQEEMRKRDVAYAEVARLKGEGYETRN